MSLLKLSQKWVVSFGLVFVWVSTLSAYRVPADGEDINMELIMSDPDWISRSPSRAYWASDNRSIYYWRKREGSQHEDLYRQSLQSGQVEVISEEDYVDHGVAMPVSNRDFSLDAYVQHGDIFVLHRTSGRIQQITRTSGIESQPVFVDGGLAWMRNSQWFLTALDSGFNRLIADVRVGLDPNAEETEDNYLEKQQEELFTYIRQQNADTLAAKLLQEKLDSEDESRAPKPLFLGKDIAIKTMSLSPDAKKLLIVTAKVNTELRSDTLPVFITADGYVEQREVRELVGRDTEEAHQLLWLDIATGALETLSWDSLPGIKKDPLKSLKKRLAKNQNQKYNDEKTQRAVYVDIYSNSPAIVWSMDGQAIVRVRSTDNKDRWITRVDFDDKRLVSEHQLHDEAWINWRFNAMGWFHNSNTMWFLSEQSGYSHLYMKGIGKTEMALTSGQWEVSNPQLASDDYHFYFTANKLNPGRYEVYRKNITGDLQQLTDLQGVNNYVLSPNQSELLIDHSETYAPNELYRLILDSNEPTKRLTHTLSDDFSRRDWIQPEFIELPSSHVDAPIYAKLYRKQNRQDDLLKPAVMFIHGAGYTQNVHEGWPYYFREQMFHTLLVNEGYVVLDIDYRASRGYGRHWRTAIYRQMGTPELEDYLDGVEWLVANAQVDRKRIGVYGGSYGGFMTFMALFKAPGVFAAGAALRPVTDWAHYNHGYTSNILNTPEVDPEAYALSSPIEWADGLADPLLIAHGMVDDNVFVKDSIRLVQKLIELKKENFELALYPAEAHSFRQPTSWLDEYRRVYQLFSRYLKPSQ